jgi:hypothetical protein
MAGGQTVAMIRHLHVLGLALGAGGDGRHCGRRCGLGLQPIHRRGDGAVPRVLAVASGSILRPLIAGGGQRRLESCLGAQPK